MSRPNDPERDRARRAAQKEARLRGGLCERKTGSERIGGQHGTNPSAQRAQRVLAKRLEGLRDQGEL